MDAEYAWGNAPYCTSSIGHEQAGLDIEGEESKSYHKTWPEGDVRPVCALVQRWELETQTCWSQPPAGIPLHNQRFILVIHCFEQSKNPESTEHSCGLSSYRKYKRHMSIIQMSWIIQTYAVYLCSWSHIFQLCLWGLTSIIRYNEVNAICKFEQTLPSSSGQTSTSFVNAYAADLRAEPWMTDTHMRSKTSYLHMWGSRCSC